MIDSAIYKAMGSGDLRESPIFQKTFDWVFMIIAVGRPLRFSDEGDEITHEDFDLSAYQTLHEFFNLELNGLSQHQYSEYEQELRGTSLMDNLAYEVGVIVDNWIEIQPERDELRTFSQILATGVLFEVFKTEIHTGPLEKQLIASCENPKHLMLYKKLYGIEKAMNQFPQSIHRKKWLEEDFGI